MTKPKAHKLPLSTQRKIGAYKTDHPKVSFVELTRIFHCTYDQTREAYRRFKAGELQDRRGRTRGHVTPSGDVAGTFRVLIDKAITALSHDKAITSFEMVQLLDKVAGILKVEQQISLQGHLKRADANLIAAIIRRYQPEATDDDVIRIYQETRAVCLTSL